MSLEIQSPFLRELLKENKFQCLEKYFIGLDEGDVFDNLNELVDWADGKDKSRMYLLVKVLRNASSCFPFLIQVRPFTLRSMENNIYTIMDFSRRIYSRFYYNKNKLSIEEISNQVSHVLKNSLYPIIIDLSENEIVDCDVSDFWNSTKDIISSKPTNSIVIRLRHTRIIYIDTAITEMLSCGSISYIDVSRTPFSSADRLDFFTQNLPNMSKITNCDSYKKLMIEFGREVTM